MSVRFFILCIFIIIIPAAPIRAQQNDSVVAKKKDCQPTDVFEMLFKKTIKPVNTTRKVDLFLLPYIAYSITKGFQIGVGGTVTWYTGKSMITNQSAASATVELTTKHQRLFQVKSNVYTARNK